MYGIATSEERLARDWCPTTGQWSGPGRGGGDDGPSRMEECGAELAGMDGLLLAAWMWSMGHADVCWRAPLWGYVMAEAGRLATEQRWPSERRLVGIVDLVLGEMRLGPEAARRVSDRDRYLALGISKSAWYKNRASNGWRPRYDAVYAVAAQVVAEARVWQGLRSVRAA